MKIIFALACFVDPKTEMLCRRRLEGVLARYTDLVRSLSVSPTGSGLRVEVMFGAGEQIAVEQAEVEGSDAVVHLADRVGRAVARRVELRANPAAAGYFDASKIPK